MPIDILHHAIGKPKSICEYFTKKFSTSLLGIKLLSNGFTSLYIFFLILDQCSSERIEHMVCCVYFTALSQLPALVRQWWSDAETRTAQIVECVTAAYVSPQLCNQELTDVAQHETKFKNMVVSSFLSVFYLNHRMSTTVRDHG